MAESTYLPRGESDCSDFEAGRPESHLPGCACLARCRGHCRIDQHNCVWLATRGAGEFSSRWKISLAARSSSSCKGRALREPEPVRCPRSSRGRRETSRKKPLPTRFASTHDARSGQARQRRPRSSNVSPTRRPPVREGSLVGARPPRFRRPRSRPRERIDPGIRDRDPSAPKFQRPCWKLQSLNCRHARSRKQGLATRFVRSSLPVGRSAGPGKGS